MVTAPYLWDRTPDAVAAPLRKDAAAAQAAQAAKPGATPTTPAPAPFVYPGVDPEKGECLKRIGTGKVALVFPVDFSLPAV